MKVVEGVGLLVGVGLAAFFFPALVPFLVADEALILGASASLIVSGITDAIRGKPLQGRDINMRNSLAPWQVVYGTCLMGGTPIAGFTADEHNQDLHLVYVHCTGKVHDIPKMYFDGIEVPVDSSSRVCNGGQYDGHLTWFYKTGDASQTAYPLLISDTNQKDFFGHYRPDRWTSADQGNGHAHSYIKYWFDDKVFPNGVPQASWLIQGRELYDPRSETTYFTNNSALCVLDYLTNAEYGMACTADEIDLDSFISAANLCDEDIPMLTLASWAAGHAYVVGDLIVDSNGNLEQCTEAGTSLGAHPTWKTTPGDITTDGVNLTWTCGLPRTSTQKRYTTDGPITINSTPQEILESLVAPMGATAALIWANGKWHLFAGAYQEASFSLTDADVRAGVSGLQYQTRIGRRDLVNCIKGTYISPANKWQAADIPPVINPKYVAEDSGYANCDDRGKWATSVSYTLADAVVDKGAVYYCKSPHTSSGGNEPGTGGGATYWTLCEEMHWKDVTYQFVTDPARARRLMKLDLESTRRMGTLVMPTFLRAMQVAAGETVTVKHENWNVDESDHTWDAKTFRVLEHIWGAEKDTNGNPMVTVTLNMQETDEDIYAWAPGEEILCVLPDSSLSGDYQAAGLVSWDNTVNITSVTAPLTPYIPPDTWDDPDNPFYPHRDVLIPESLDNFRRAEIAE